MDAGCRRALNTIRRCVDEGRYVVLHHFVQRMDQRGLFWPDVLAVIDDPADVKGKGPDRYGRPKWILTGTASDGLEIELVCVLDRDEHGDLTVFITSY